MITNERASRRAFLAGAAGATLVGAAGLCAAAGEQPAPSANTWQIGCYTRPWDQHEYLVALDAIAEAGFKYAGLMTAKAPGGLVISASTSIEDARKAGEECAQRGLSIPSVYGGGIPVQESLDAGIAALRRLIDNCEAAKAANLMMGGVSDPAHYEPYYRAIAACCDYAAGKKIGISVKPHGGSNSTGPQCRAVIEFVNHPSFRLWYDPGNIFYYSDGALDPLTDAATVDGLVAGMSVKDYQPPKEVMITPGTGKVDFTGVLRRLIQGGFTGGPLIVECLTRGELPFMLEQAKKARQFLESTVAAV